MDIKPKEWRETVRERRERKKRARQILSQKNGARLQEREERKKQWGETDIKPKEWGETVRKRKEEKTGARQILSQKNGARLMERRAQKKLGRGKK